MSNLYQLSQEQAMAIVEAHEIDALLGNTEERELLEENHPDLLDAYEQLLLVAGIS